MFPAAVYKTLCLVFPVVVYKTLPAVVCDRLANATGASFVCVAIHLTTTTCILMLVFTAADGEELLLQLPANFQEAQAVKATLALYKENCSGLVIALLIAFYLFLQVSTSSIAVLPGRLNPLIMGSHRLLLAMTWLM